MDVGLVVDIGRIGTGFLAYLILAYLYSNMPDVLHTLFLQIILWWIALGLFAQKDPFKPSPLLLWLQTKPAIVTSSRPVPIDMKSPRSVFVILHRRSDKAATKLSRSCYKVGPIKDSSCLTSLPTPIHKRIHKGGRR